MNLYSKESLCDYENDLLNKTMDHFGNSKKKIKKMYKNTHSQKNLFDHRLKKEKVYKKPRLKSRKNQKQNYTLPASKIISLLYLVSLRVSTGIISLLF